MTTRGSYKESVAPSWVFVDPELENYNQFSELNSPATLLPSLLPDVPLPTYTSLFEKQKLPASFPWDGPFCLASLAYEDCAPRKSCGDGMNVSFPFYIRNLQPSYCGYPGFELDCNNNGSSLIIQISGNNYLVDRINYEGKYLQLRNSPTTCPLAIKNLTFDNNDDVIFRLYSNEKVVFLMNCDISQLPNKNLTRYRIGSCDQLVMDYDNWNLGIGMEVCTQMVVAPVRGIDFGTWVDGGNYKEVMKWGFILLWDAQDCSTCTQSGGSYDEKHANKVLIARNKSSGIASKVVSSHRIITAY
ncbi:concanavalin A-like lectin/glucanase [Tanacetum coccineum]